MTSGNELDDDAVDDLRVVTHTSEIKRSWPVWSSQLEDLKVVARRFEELAGRQRQAELREAADVKDNEKLLTSIKERWRVEAVASEPSLRQTLSGPPERVIAELDQKEVQGFILRTDLRRYGIGDPGLSVSFQRSEPDWYTDRFGVELQLSSTDYGWVQEAKDSLTTAIERGVPWWSFLRGRRATWMYGSVTGIAATIAIWPVVPFFALWFGVIAGFGGGLASFWLLRRYFPAFEILSSGSKARAAILLTVFGSFAAQIIIGVLIAVLVPH